MSNVFEELVTLTNVALQDGEDTQTYLHRVVKAINDLSEEDWNKIPGEGQAWFNDSAKLIGEAPEGVLPEIPVIPGMPVDDKPTKAKKEKKVKEPKEPKAEKKPKREGPPVTSIVRDMVCQNMDLSFTEIKAMLEAQNVAIADSSAQVVYLTAQKTIEAIKRVGGVKDKDGNVVISYNS
jgi:hypothetical protein